MRLAGLLLALLLAGCQRPDILPPVDQTATTAPEALPATASISAEEAVVADQPLPLVVESASEVVAAPLSAVQDAIQQVVDPIPPPAIDPVVAAAAVELIVRWEITSPAFYAKRLVNPIWPGGASGVTWCIGYDGGHQTERVILDDWLGHPDRYRLGTTAGIRGKAAAAALPRYRQIVTPYADCVIVFSERTLIEYERRTRRAFGPGYDLLKPAAKGALVSLVYNRGGSMTGDNRREMRVIRDECVPAQDYSCIAAQLRAMIRLWRGTVNEKGLAARREAEARVVER